MVIVMVIVGWMYAGRWSTAKKNWSTVNNLTNGQQLFGRWSTTQNVWMVEKRSPTGWTMVHDTERVDKKAQRLAGRRSTTQNVKMIMMVEKRFRTITDLSDVGP